MTDSMPEHQSSPRHQYSEHGFWRARRARPLDEADLDRSPELDGDAHWLGLMLGGALVLIGGALMYRAISSIPVSVSKSREAWDTKREEDAKVDLMSQESFPASDAPAY